MECKNCQGLCIKKGCQKRKQRYYCKICKLYQLKTYRNKNCTGADEDLIIKLNNEGVGKFSNFLHATSGKYYKGDPAGPEALGEIMVDQLDNIIQSVKANG